MAAPQGAMQVRETWMLYDNVVIGSNVPSVWPGCFTSFAAMAQAQDIGFLDVRQTSECNLAVTNVTSKTKVPWPFYLESLGVRFNYPNPYNAQIAQGAEAAAKIFQEVIADHAWLEFKIREDTRLTIKPTMTGCGYGAYGSVALGFAFNNSFAVIESSGGVNSPGNRWQWIGEPLMIPDDTPISARMTFDPYAKLLLAQLRLEPFVLTEEAADFPNWASIELTLRGQRLVQQRGEYYAS